MDESFARLKSSAGMTFPELLVGIFIFATLAMAVAGMATLGTRSALVNEQLTVAQGIAAVGLI